MESIGPLMATPLRDTAYGELVAGAQEEKCAAAFGSANRSGPCVSFDEIISGHFPKWPDAPEFLSGPMSAWVNVVILTVRRSLPAYPGKQTFSEPVAASHLCRVEV